METNLAWLSFRYTERFDKVQLNKVVEDVSELDIPEVVDRLAPCTYKLFEYDPFLSAVLYSARLRS